MNVKKILTAPLAAACAVPPPIHVLDGCAWGLTAVAFADAAVALTREPRRDQN